MPSSCEEGHISETCGAWLLPAVREHRANILNGYYHYVGTAWGLAANGTAHIAVEFSCQGFEREFS